MAAIDNWWYSPQCMLMFADLAMRPYAASGTTPPGDLQNAVDEGRAGAIFALGLADFVGAETWMRLVHPREQAPDIRIMYVDDSGPKGSHVMRTLQVEVTTYTKHSTESLSEFLFRTKLDPSKKAYSSDTVIVARFERDSTPPEIAAVTQQLHNRSAQGLCYLIGRLDQVRFQVVRAFPTFGGPQEVNLDEAFNSSQEAVAEVKRGMSSVTKVSDEPIPTANPFLTLFVKLGVREHLGGPVPARLRCSPEFG